LDGPPEAGKSTIAAAIAILKASEGFEIIYLVGGEDFFTAYDADASQLFIADDAVGSIKFDPALSESWSRHVGGILPKLDQMHMLVWTTRKYVLEEALLAACRT
jgi:hypothetical protein